MVPVTKTSHLTALNDNMPIALTTHIMMSQRDVLWRLRSFNVCNQMLLMFYQPVVMSTIFIFFEAWDTGIKVKDTNRLNKVISKAGSVVSSQLATLEELVEMRVLTKN